MRLGVGGGVGPIRGGVSVSSRGVGGGIGLGPFSVTGGAGSAVRVFELAGAVIIASVLVYAVLFLVALLLLSPLLLVAYTAWYHVKFKYFTHAYVPQYAPSGLEFAVLEADVATDDVDDEYVSAVRLRILGPDALPARAWEPARLPYPESRPPGGGSVAPPSSTLLQRS